MKKILLFCIFVAVLSACAPADSPSEASTAGINSESAASMPEGPAEGGTEETLDTAAPPLLEIGDDCGIDGKLACPLVKPTKGMTPKYDRTPEQLARMEAFDQLTLEEKFIALDQGFIVCTEFIHDEEWEHQIDAALIESVGRDKFDQWTEMDDGCHSIYHFANAFRLEYGDLEKVIREKGLEDLYPLDALKAGMEKWRDG